MDLVSLAANITFAFLGDKRFKAQSNAGMRRRVSISACVWGMGRTSSANV